jgi:ATP-dependent DNA helicase HFM1/MER3
MASDPWDADYGGDRSAGFVGAERGSPEGPNPPTYTDLRRSSALRTVKELPRCFQPAFAAFRYFNGVQSEMMDFVLSSPRSFVVSARPPPRPRRTLSTTL